MYLPWILVALTTCDALRGHNDLAALAVPREFVIDDSKLIDLTGFFSGKTWSMDGMTWRCCKRNADGLGMLHAETDLIDNSCRSLAGLGFKSFSHFSPATCIVPFASLKPGWKRSLETAPIVGELVDLSDVLMEGHGEVILSDGRRIRCCTAHDVPSSVLVDMSKQKDNALDGTKLSFVHRLGSFNNRKCRGLLGNNFHSWDKWDGGRCLVMSQDIPSDILAVLKWNSAEIEPEPLQLPDSPLQMPDSPLDEPEPQKRPETPPKTVETSPETVPERLPETPAEKPSEAPQETQETPPETAPKTSWGLGVRVVSATTQQTIAGVSVHLLKDDRTSISTSTSNDVGVASFDVPDTVLKVVISIKADGYSSVSRAYKWKNPAVSHRSDCRGKEKCFTQVALSPGFAS